MCCPSNMCLFFARGRVQNISLFVRAAQGLGVRKLDCFDAPDLHAGNNLHKVSLALSKDWSP